VNGGFPCRGNTSPEELIPTDLGLCGKGEGKVMEDRFQGNLPFGWWGDMMAGDPTLHAITEQVGLVVRGVLPREVEAEMPESFITTGHGACLATASDDMVSVF
jgi:hypothetical protein